MSLEPIEYHRGYLARDRDDENQSFEKRMRIDTEARIYWGRMLLGEGFLVQRVIEPGVWSYLFVPRVRHG